jgi:hypothetical protein
VAATATARVLVATLLPVAQRWHELTGPPSARREMVRVVAIAGTRRRP